MIGCAGWIVVGGVFLGPVADDEVAKERARFEGVWSFSLVEVDGVKQPDVPFETNKMVVSKDGSYLVMQGPRVTHGVMAIDSTQSPKHLDVTITNGPIKGQTFAAIYELDGDIYTFCSSLRGKERPPAFTRGPGTGFIFEIMNREKQSVKDGLIAVSRRELTGTWHVQNASDNGSATPTLDFSTLVIDADGKMTFRQGDTTRVTATTLLDPTTTPMRLDWTRADGEFAGRTDLGIFKLEDDLLTICQATSGKPRPTEFSAEANRGHALLTFQRVQGGRE